MTRPKKPHERLPLGRPPAGSPRTAPVGTRLSVEDDARLRAIAATRGVSVAALVAEVLAKWLARQ